MNTVEKGDLFEGRVFESIQDLVKSGYLGLNPDCCRLFKKKGYYSRDRDSNIVVDISIEIWMPGADDWSMLWVFECKDYSKPVPVDDVEEFKAKLNQITGVNVKGLFVTSSAYQRGALNYSRSHGLGLLRLLPDDQIDILMYFVTPDLLKKQEQKRKTEYKQALINQSHRTEGSGFYSIYNGYVYHSWKALFKDYLEEHVDKIS
ncbi:restriction endonuclease [Vibrio sp. SCSIO 43136]|uniref:restriction endonuclease n=1 Tax=Vibrio sp. SCSIO 43136 TaxID=2819101 RepID=UPI00207648BF|nr:restriction endonuclease [Vibrio sp. SCSIO 43136]USD66842.1 restriction endonuclease [Vibrio sp. SCSIO 43136]